MRRRLFVYICLIFLVSPPTQAEDDFSVAVTIKPLHALVAGVMKGAGEPVLIMNTGASPHHYSLRPSERRALSDASLIVWVGPELEGFMPRILESLTRPGNAIALIDADGMLRLPARSSHGHEHAHGRVDPHIWLSAGNARAMVDIIADELVRRDGGNAAVYESNRKRMHQRVTDTDQQIRRMLSGKTAAFLSYHDAYQYFEHEYGLNNAGFVSDSDELKPGARHVHELRETIDTRQIHCLFYEAPNRPALVDTLIQDYPVNVQELDAMGINTGAGEDAWFDIMTALARAAGACL